MTMRWFGHVRTQKVFADCLLFNLRQRNISNTRTPAFVTLLLTQLWCRIQDDCYKLPRHLKTWCFSWSWGLGRGGEGRGNASCCGTVLRNRSLQWNIVREQIIFKYFRGYKRQRFCAELRAYKMQQSTCTWFASQWVAPMSFPVPVLDLWGIHTSSQKTRF